MEKRVWSRAEKGSISVSLKKKRKSSYEGGLLDNKKRGKKLGVGFLFWLAIREVRRGGKSGGLKEKRLVCLGQQRKEKGRGVPRQGGWLFFYFKGLERFGVN